MDLRDLSDLADFPDLSDLSDLSDFPAMSAFFMSHERSHLTDSRNHVYHKNFVRLSNSIAAFICSFLMAFLDRPMTLTMVTFQRK